MHSVWNEMCNLSPHKIVIIYPEAVPNVNEILMSRNFHNTMPGTYRIHWKCYYNENKVTLRQNETHRRTKTKFPYLNKSNVYFIHTPTHSTPDLSRWRHHDLQSFLKNQGGKIIFDWRKGRKENNTQQSQRVDFMKFDQYQMCSESYYLKQLFGTWNLIQWRESLESVIEFRFSQ
jgi:hypothetical protein